MAGLATSFGSGSMTNPIADIEAVGCLLVIGSNTTEAHPIIGSRIKKAVRECGARLIVVDPRKTELASLADLWIRPNVGSDIPLLNAFARVILEEGLWDRAFVEERTEGFSAWKESVNRLTVEEAAAIAGVPAEQIRTAARMYAQPSNGASSIVYCLGITEHICGTDNVLACANLAMLTGNIGRPGTGVNPLRGQNNVQGACDMGCLPAYLPGYQKLADDAVRAKFSQAWGRQVPTTTGFTVREMFDAALTGDVRAMLIVGANVAVTEADSHRVQQALKALDFLVVSDIFMSDVARYAHVVLPDASFIEKDGTFTNTERRVQRIRRAVPPVGNSRPSWQAVCEIANRTIQRLGLDLKPFEYAGAEQIFAEMASLSPSMAGMSYARLEQGGLQWPCPDENHPGTPRLHVGKFTRGLGLFSPVEYRPPAEVPDGDYPLTLCTGRVLYHYHSGTSTHRVPGLVELFPETLIEINNVDAEQLGIEDGDMVRVVSRRGQVEVRASVSDKCPTGTVWMDFHFSNVPTNELTSSAIDPVAKTAELKACAVRVTKLSRELDLAGSAAITAVR